MPAHHSPPRLSRSDTALLIVDVQEKLLPKIADGALLVRNIAFLIDVCRAMEIPVTVTEQYPKGLGPTVSELTSRLPGDRPEKVAFSSCAIDSVVAGFQTSARPKILVCGIESHVCVMQTVLDLLARGFTPFIAVDAISSRYRHDHEVAIRRMEQAGAVPVTVEMAAFELTAVAGTPLFKDISRLVQERMKSLNPNGTALNA